MANKIIPCGGWYYKDNQITIEKNTRWATFN